MDIFLIREIFRIITEVKSTLGSLQTTASFYLHVIDC